VNEALAEHAEHQADDQQRRRSNTASLTAKPGRPAPCGPDARNPGSDLGGTHPNVIAADGTTELDDIRVGHGDDVELLKLRIIEQGGLDLRGDRRVVNIFAGRVGRVAGRSTGAIGSTATRAKTRRIPNAFL